jgi:glycosyltransferase involved in cell wall biosynthesis
MAELTLSILTPAVPSRLEQLGRLCAELTSQIGDKPVEHLTLLDNKRRSVGEKRDALLRAARGKYVAYVDDDDWIEYNYVSAILGAVGSNPDVVTFRQQCTVNGRDGIIEFGLGNPNEPFAAGGYAKRNAWHICAWRRQLAICSGFPPINYGEDWAFASRLCALPGLSSIHVPEILHYYRHDAKTTEAPPPQ